MKRFLTSTASVFALLSVFFFTGCDPRTEVSPESSRGDESVGGHGHGHGHGHGDLPYEWSAAYDLDAGPHTLKFGESDHDPSILIAFFKEGREAEDVQHAALHVMEGGGQPVSNEGSFTVREGTAYNLILNPNGSSYTFEIEEPARYLLFTEHFAWEFDMAILDSDGIEVEALNPTDHADANGR